MDSAFKRRWDWEYVPINDSFTEENQSSKFIVKLSEKERIEEIARLMSGDNINKAALEIAKALMN